MPGCPQVSGAGGLPPHLLQEMHLAVAEKVHDTAVESNNVLCYAAFTKEMRQLTVICAVQAGDLPLLQKTSKPQLDLCHV